MHASLQTETVRQGAETRGSSAHVRWYSGLVFQAYIDARAEVEECVYKKFTRVRTMGGMQLSCMRTSMSSVSSFGENWYHASDTRSYEAGAYE